MVNHVRRFVHGTMCIQIFMKRLETAMPNYHDNILMWGWCRRCKQVHNKFYLRAIILFSVYQVVTKLQKIVKWHLLFCSPVVCLCHTGGIVRHPLPVVRHPSGLLQLNYCRKPHSSANIFHMPGLYLQDIGGGSYIVYWS